MMVPRPLPRVLIVHTGGTLGMDPVASYESDLTGQQLKKGGAYKGTLGPGQPLLLLVCMQHGLCMYTASLCMHAARALHAYGEDWVCIQSGPCLHCSHAGQKLAASC